MGILSSHGRLAGDSPVWGGVFPGDGWYVETPTPVAEAFPCEKKRGLFFTAGRVFSTPNPRRVFDPSPSTGWGARATHERLDAFQNAEGVPSPFPIASAPFLFCPKAQTSGNREPTDQIKQSLREQRHHCGGDRAFKDE